MGQVIDHETVYSRFLQCNNITTCYICVYCISLHHDLHLLWLCLESTLVVPLDCRVDTCALLINEYKRHIVFCSCFQRHRRGKFIHATIPQVVLF